MKPQCTSAPIPIWRSWSTGQFWSRSPNVYEKSYLNSCVSCVGHAHHPICLDASVPWKAPPNERIAAAACDLAVLSHLLLACWGLLQQFWHLQSPLLQSNPIPLHEYIPWAPECFNSSSSYAPEKINKQHLGGKTREKKNTSRSNFTLGNWIETFVRW